MNNQIIGRSSGRSAVAASAYRRGARMEDATQERVADYSRKENVAHSEITVGEDAPEWVQELSRADGHSGSESLWNKVEAFENRKDAQLAREMIVALPKELSVEQSAGLVREFVKQEFASRDLVADWSIHDEDGNPHAHIMIPMRPVTDAGFGMKRKPLVNGDGEVVFRKNGKPFYKLVFGEKEDLNRWRESWATVQNEHLAHHGFDVRVDHRSNVERGLSIEAGVHMGPAGHGAFMRGRDSYQARKLEEIRVRNAELVLKDPGEIIRKVAHNRSVFTEMDLIKEAGKYLNSASEIEVFRVRVMQSPELVKLADEVHHETKGWLVSAARYTSQEMLSIETEMAGLASKMASVESHGITLNQGKAALSEFSFLGHEQQVAVEHVLIDRQLSSVVGFAGSGKTTMVEAAKHAWEAGGYTVKGGALSGIAAQGLGDGAGIESRTLASWEYAWERGRDLLTNKDVLVIDEAGMVGSRQMRDVLSRVNDAGAKVVLIGDAEQLQPIEAGAAFRAITERSGAAEIGEIRRQHEDWMREASKKFATHKTEEAFAAYQERGHVVHELSAEDAKLKLVSDWMGAHEQEGSQIILAHRRVDVADLNLRIRDGLIEGGGLSGGSELEVAGGVREFAPGEQVIFQKNDRDLGVKNGMLGQIEKMGASSLDVRVGSGEGAGHLIHVDLKSYNHVDYGYAATIHKSQGVTVDRSFVYGSSSMDRHLAYVSMTRHREDVTFYSSADEFRSPEMIGTKLSRARLQSTTLDYLERHQAVPEQDRAAYLRHLYERQVERLKAVAERLSEIPTRLKHRFGLEVAAPTPVDVRSASEQGRTPAPVQQAARDVGDGLAAKPLMPAITADKALRARVEFLEPKVMEEHVTSQTVVKNALNRLKDGAKFVSPEFQREVAVLTAHQVENGAVVKLMNEHKVGDRDRALVDRDVVAIKQKIEGSRKQYLDSVERAISRASIEVPSLSPSANKLVSALTNARSAEAADQILKGEPSSPRLIEEIKGFETALKTRFGVTNVDQVSVSRPIDLKLSGVKLEQIDVAVKAISRVQTQVAQVERLAQSLKPGRGFTPGL